MSLQGTGKFVHAVCLVFAADRLFRNVILAIDIYQFAICHLSSDISFGDASRQS
jgi:hypothetical protein